MYQMFCVIHNLNDIVYDDRFYISFICCLTFQYNKVKIEKLMNYTTYMNFY